MRTALIQYAPIGVDVPRDPTTSAIDTVTIDRWSSDAAKKINAQRRVTTQFETEITLVADQQLYSLPTGARDPITVMRKRNSLSAIDDPLSLELRQPIYHSPFGVLPTGQEVDPALDLIQRQNQTRVRREDDFELSGTKIRLLFPIVAGEKVVVKYQKPDLTLASVPSDYFELILTYMRYMLLDWFISTRGAGVAVVGTSLSGSNDIMALQRTKQDLWGTWVSGVNAIGPEVG